jgi:tripartite-type tricarboxylate transporter receptor subunit TctC
VKALQAPEIKDRLVSNGFVAVGNTPAEFTAFVEAETGKWGQVIKTANIQAE